MFAPGPGDQPAKSLRSSRRRQRTSLEDSVKPPAAKRQRSSLRQDTKQPSIKKDTVSDETSANKEGSRLQTQGNKTEPRTERALVIRSSERTTKPKTQSDHDVVLSSNDYYTVTQLSSGAEQSEETIYGPTRCVFDTASGFALLLSQSRASVWPYQSSLRTQGNSGPLSIMMPDWCTSDGEALMGTLVSSTAHTVPGLFIVHPTSGKMIYWETASNVTALGIAKQKQSGLQGSITPLSFGEKIIEVLNAEPSGVITTLSSGRIAQITFRNSQGKSALCVNFLQSTAKSASGGLFSGIKNVLVGSMWRKDLAAVKAASSSFRGQRDVMALSTSGLLEVWDSHWNGVNKLRAEIDLRSELSSYLQHELDEKPGLSFTIHDFVPIAHEMNPSAKPEENSETILFIVLETSPKTPASSLVILQVHIHDGNVRIQRLIKLENMATYNGAEKNKARLHISSSQDTAFVLLGRKVCIMSLQEIVASPSVQLLNGVIPKPFQDRIQFQEGDKYEILGFESEAPSPEKQQTSGCILMIRGYGLIRISTTSSSLDTTEIVSITAKQKLEQAVFFGTMSNTPLQFNADDEPSFTGQEFEAAALQISDEILRSTSRYIPNVDISLYQNLRRRSKALNDLTTELIRRKIPLSKRARWELCWAGEKLAAQRSLWDLEENFRERWNADTFLSQVINLMSDKFRTPYEPSANDKQNDHVRQWFARDTFQMQHIIPWIFNAIRGVRGPSARPGRDFLHTVYQASELTVAVLDTAYQFREDHTLQYGLDQDDGDSGIPFNTSSDIPECWTSEIMVYSEMLQMLELELELPKWMYQSPSSMPADDRDMLMTIAENSCRRFRLLITMLDERVNWLLAQNDPKLAEEAIAFKDKSVKQRKWQLYKMAGVGQLQGALDLAEESRDLEALVELMVELQDQIRKGKRPSEKDFPTKSAVAHDESEYKQKITTYFNNFGEPFADAFFTRYIGLGQPGVLLTMKDYQTYLTKFLRKSPSYAPLSWINDVVGEGDYEQASIALEKLALSHTDNLWDQRLQLSLSKLTKLASLEGGAVPENSASRSLERLENELELGTLQERLYDHVLPTFQSAIDERAEVELVMDQFGGQVVDRPALKDILEDLMTRLVRRKALDADQLINSLTLMDDIDLLEGEDSPIHRNEFYLALRILRLSGYASSDPVRYNFLHRLVWRRCLIRDDWKSISSTEFHSDGENISLFGNTTLARTLISCTREEAFYNRAQGEMYPLPEPSTLTGLGSVELVRSRFQPEQWPLIESELNTEADQLKRLLEETRLKEWFSGLQLLAKDSLASFTKERVAESLIPGSVNAKFYWA